MRSTLSNQEWSCSVDVIPSILVKCRVCSQVGIAHTRQAVVLVNPKKVCTRD